MASHQEKISKLKKAINNNNKKKFQLDETVASLLDWFSQIQFPHYPDAEYWNDIVTVFPDHPNEAEVPSDGLKIRISLKLYTATNAYMITILECLNNDANDINIITVHVNWDETELQVEESLGKKYNKQFTDMLKAKHTIWAQTYRLLELHTALDSCMMAIMGHELKGTAPKTQKEILKHPLHQKAEFPDRD